MIVTPKMKLQKVLAVRGRSDEDEVMCHGFQIEKNFHAQDGIVFLCCDSALCIGQTEPTAAAKWLRASSLWPPVGMTHVF